MKTRKQQPKNNKYFIRQVSGGYNGAVKGSPTISGADVLCNCVGYANGRFNEIGEYGRCKFQLVCNAENFIESARKQGLHISSKPVQGGIMVWQRGATLSGGDGAGHVAVVEEVYDDGSILTSESGWSSWAFKTVRRNNSNGRWGQASAYKFRGCIVNPAVNGEVVPTPKLAIDGVGGPATIMAMQEFLGTPEDGLLSGQNKSLKKYYPAITAVSYGSGVSTCVKKLQKWLGVSADGVWGEETSKALQKKLGVTDDGIFGSGSVKALQKFLNSELDKKDGKKEEKKEDPKPAKTDYLVIDVSEFQSTIDWAKAKAAGVKGTIIRCGYRGYGKGTLQQDKMFLNHIKGAYAAGVKVGVYFFTEAISAAEGKEEAAYTLNLVKKAGIPLSYPIAIDTEHINANARANNISKAKRTEAIKAFCDEIQRQGYEAMIYASLTWFYDKLDMSKLPYKIWCAQYNSKCDYKGDYVMWQYTSTGKISGVPGVVDLNHCYIEGVKVPENDIKVPEKTEEKKGYTGKMPTLALKKSNAEVIEDAIRFAKWIVNDKRFGYGRKGGAKYEGTKEYSITHSGGCHFCGSNASKISKAKKAGLKNPEEWEFTFVCNTLVHACFAHAGVMSMLNARGHAWWISSYQKSKYWKEIKKPAKLTDLKAGDVLFTKSHAMLYIGGGKIAEATSSGGDPSSSKSAWENSIRIKNYSASKFKSVTNVFRFTGTVNSTALIRYGEVSARVELLQKYLTWYGISLTADGIFGDATLNAVKQFQKEQGLTVDGIVGNDTLSAMGKVVK